MAAYYDSAAIFIDTATQNCDKVTKIDLILDALYTNALKAAANDNITEYSLNDGQTIIRTTYRGAAEVMKSIKSFEALRQMYLNRLNGRMVRLVDSKSI